MAAKIPLLPPATLPLAGTEPLELVQDGLSKQIQAQDLAGVTPPLAATYVTVTANATLPNERILAVGTNLSLVDGGAGASITLDMADMADATVKGRALGAGLGAPTDLSAAQLAAILGGVGFGYLTLAAIGRVTGSDAGTANIADDVIVMGRDAAVLMADTDFQGSVVIGTSAWSRSVGSATTRGSAVVIGQNALLNNTSAVSGSSVVIGTGAAESSVADNTSPTTQSVIIGAEAAQQAADNPLSNAILIGYRAGRCNTANGFVTPNGQVFIGSLAGQNQQSAVNCTAVGTGAMSLGALIGSENTCFGNLAGSGLSTGANNTLLGSSAGTGLSGESDNVMVGQSIVAIAAQSVFIGNQTASFAGMTEGIVIGHLSGRNLIAGDGQFVVESSPSIGLNRLAFLYGSTLDGNLALGQAQDGGGLPINRDFGGGTPINVYKIQDTSSAPTTAATAGATMWSAAGILNIFGGVANRGESFFLGIQTPAALGGGVTNNWAPTLTGATRIEFSGGAAAEVTGLVGGTDGRFLIFTNIGATNNVIFRDEDVLSTAANRFNMNGDVIVPPGASITFMYSTTTSRWTRINSA